MWLILDVWQYLSFSQKYVLSWNPIIALVMRDWIDHGIWANLLLLADIIGFCTLGWHCWTSWLKTCHIIYDLSNIYMYTKVKADLITVSANIPGTAYSLQNGSMSFFLNSSFGTGSSSVFLTSELYSGCSQVLLTHCPPKGCGFGLKCVIIKCVVLRLFWWEFPVLLPSAVDGQHRALLMISEH